MKLKQKNRLLLHGRPDTERSSDAASTLKIPNGPYPALPRSIRLVLSPSSLRAQSEHYLVFDYRLALESAGRRAEALAEYDRFLTTRKDADRDAPEAVGARVRVKASGSR